MAQTDLGRWILSGVAVTTATSGFLADWNRTHLFNPEWTPHSKFHDAWTVLLGAGLGAISLRALWSSEPDPELAALLPALFWATQAGSYAFPGATGIASEFPEAAARVGLSRFSEGVASASMLALTAAGYALTRRQHRA
jgi:hypothetical protein